MATDVFVSDVHGNHDTFQAIMDSLPEGASLHMVGDVYDRGPDPDKVMDALAQWPDLDIQWGNHDILWMGASLGQPGCVANVVRICARYGNLDVLEQTYGIDLSHVKDLAYSIYENDPCAAFGLKGSPALDQTQVREAVCVQKAMAYIQFKVEHGLIAQNPGFGLESRNLLHLIDYKTGTVQLDGVTYLLKDTVFPTIDPANPYALTPPEQRLLSELQDQFRNCEKLQEHMEVLVGRGSLYKKLDDILLFHACVPLSGDGSLLETDVLGTPLSGRALFDVADAAVRDAFAAQDPEARKRGADVLWYLWLGPASPLFAKSKMATFELYQIEDKAARTEEKNPFYKLLGQTETAERIFEDFGMDPHTSRIVCGHVPVKVKDGESPVKCGGKLICIDGGMALAYQPTTGIGGFLLVRNGEGLRLCTLPTAEECRSLTHGSLEQLGSWEALA